MLETSSLITHRLRPRRLVVDRVFDDIFPSELRSASSIHWTPVEVAMRAAQLLARGNRNTILDIGSGIGKFCLVAAASAKARVRGIEHRARFVDVARDAAKTLGVDVEFVHGTLEDEDASSVDVIYMFNPFAENLCGREDWLDDSVELSERRFCRDVALAERFLRDARAGTRRSGRSADARISVAGSRPVARSPRRARASRARRCRTEGTASR